MESNARRRLDRIHRHFLDSQKPSDVLQPELLSNGKLKNVEAVIIGGMVLDIHATTSLPTTPRTTTPGMVNYVLGGVARNIAECVSKLGTKPFMISVLGDDMAGNLLLEHWKSSKLSTEGIQKQQQIKTAVVLNIFDNKGEVAAGVASVEAIEKFLTPEWIHKFKHNIHSAPLLMVDANLNLPALEYSCQIAAESNTPIWFEPVSVAKSRRIVSIAKYVCFASPNETELIAMANALSGRESFSYTPNDNHSTESLFQTLKPAIWVLLRSGVKILVVTLGPNGVFLCCEGGPGSMKTTDRSSADPEGRLFGVHYPALSAAVVRLTGAGDCLVGGAISSLCDGSDVMMSIAVGIAASKAAVESETNVPSSFDLAAIADDARLVYSRAKVVCHESMH